jgi:hypothetical protein
VVDDRQLERRLAELLLQRRGQRGRRRRDVRRRDGAIFAKDLAEATEVTRERWAQRDAYARMSEFTARWFEQQL